MRKLLFGILMTACLASFSLAGFDLNRLELRFGLGPGYWSGGDFNRALKGGDDYNREVLTYLEGTYRPLGFSYNLSTEAVYWLNPRMGVGLSLGYASAPVGEYSIVGRDQGMETTLTYRASAMSIEPSFHYGFPVCDDAFLDFFFGHAFYSGCFHFQKNIDIEPDDYTSTFEFDGTSSALGLHGGASLDYKLNDHLRLYGAVKADMTSLGNLDDAWTSQVHTPGGTFSQSGTGTLWVYDYQPDGSSYPFWGFGSAAPSGPAYSNVKKGSIGGPAVGFELGIKYQF